MIIILTLIVTTILSIISFSLNANIKPGLDTNQIVYYNTLKSLISAIYTESIQDTLALSMATNVNNNVTIDTTSLPPLERCQSNLRLNVALLNATATNLNVQLLAFYSSISYTTQINNLLNLTNTLLILETTLQGSGIITNHTSVLNTTEPNWKYYLQSITLGNNPLYYIKFPRGQSYNVPQNNTVDIPLDISSVIVSGIPYRTDQPIIDDQALKLINAPSGVNLVSRLFNTTNTLYLVSSLALNSNDFLFILKDFEISL
jgi:hypothetical protein